MSLLTASRFSNSQTFRQLSTKKPRQLLGLFYGKLCFTDSETLTVSFTESGLQSGDGVTVAIVAFDNVGVSRIELYVDSQLKKTAKLTHEVRLNCCMGAQGAHLLTTKAFDAMGNVATDSITVFK